MLATYAASWLRRRSAGLRPRSRIAYEYVLTHYVVPLLGTLELHEISRKHVRMMMQRMADAGRAASTIKGARAVLSGVLSSALDDELILANPCSRVGTDILKGSRRPKRYVPTPPQVELFLRHATQKKQPLFLVMAEAALRVGEALALRGTDVRIDRRELLVERALGQDGHLGPVKYGRPRVVPLTALLLETLAPLAEQRGEGWIFPGPCGPLHYSSVKKAIDRTVKRAKVPRFSAHALRHACASRLASRGIPAQFIQRMLGHASVALTIDTYGSHFPLERPEKFDAD